MDDQVERRTLRRNIRELPGPAWILVAGQFVNWFASFAVFYLVLYLTRRGLGYAAAGVAVAAYGAGDLLSGLLTGHLADRIGRGTTMAASMLASGVFTLALYFVHPYWAVVPLAFLAGVATEGWRPASRALMTDLVPEGRRVTAFALVRTAGNLGFAGGAAVAGFLANQSFLWVFVADAATSALFAIIVLVALPQGRVTRRDEEAREGGGYRRILSDRSFLLFLVATSLAAFVYFQQQGGALPLHVVRASHLRPSVFGLMLTLNGILVAALELPLSALTMRRPPREMIAVGFALIGAGFGLTAFAHSLAPLLATTAVWSLGEMIAAPVGYAYVADLAPEHLRGRYQGIYGVFFGAGTVSGPALGTVLFTWSPMGVWTICGVLGLVAALLVMAGRPMAPGRPGATIVLPETSARDVTVVTGEGSSIPG